MSWWHSTIIPYKKVVYKIQMDNRNKGLGLEDQITKNANVSAFHDFQQFSLDSVTQFSFLQVYISAISWCWAKTILLSYTHEVLYVEVSYTGSAEQLWECCLP